MSDVDLLKTPLYALHQELGARMVPFAGYAMPVQYKGGLIAEHRHTRAAASLFDVSHMGQLELIGPDAAAALETLIPADVLGLGVDKQRYGLLLSDEGTILDDFMFVNRGDDRLFLIVNGACKVDDIAHIRARIGSRCTVQPMPEQGLLALQGPQAAAALARHIPDATELRFMTGRALEWNGTPVYVTRSGYTGEDGFEISISGDRVEALARALLAEPEVAPAGLGARNSLRLEAGLCLYGNDMDRSTTPVEAGLNWAVQKSRRTGGERAGGFCGADKILAQMDGSLPLQRKRIGLVAQQRVPVREPAPLQDAAGNTVGQVTSGLLAPSLDVPVAMGYVAPEHTTLGMELNAVVRGKAVPMQVSAMPFIAPRHKR